MVRPPCVDSNGMKKGAWSEEEDDKLRAYVMRYGHWNWRLLPKYAGLARCGKSCRLRWVNYLKPGVKRGGFDKEEEELIIKLHAQLGNKWSAIATKLPGRTDNEIKNFYHTRIEKTRKRSSITSSKSGHDDHSDDQDYCSLKGFDSNKIQESTPSFDHHNSSSHEITQSSEVDLWSDLFLTDTNCNIQNDGFPKSIHHEDLLISPHQVLHYSGLSSSDSSYMSALDWIGDDEHSIMSSEYVVPSIQGSFWNESSSSNHPSGESPTQEQGLGDFYDPLFHDCFDYGMNLFS